MNIEYLPLSAVGKVARGKSKHRPRNDPKLYGGKYPFIQTGDVKKADLYITEYSQTYNEEGLAQSKLWEAETVCITIAANIADSALLKFPACFPDSVIGFIPYQDKADAKFIKYSLDVLQSKFKGISQGAAQDNLSMEKLETIKFPIPPIATQRRIADILSTYDRLIENNRKQIVLLEEAAQRLYREWFIDLRFPGHENTKIVDGVPEGWERNKTSSFFDISIGKTPPRKNSSLFSSNGTKWASVSDMGNAITWLSYTKECITEDAVKKYNIKILPEDTILLSFKLTIGRVAIITEPMATNEAIAHFRTIEKPELKEYTYSYLKAFDYESLGSTSSISKAVNSQIIKAMPFVMPDSETLCRYHRKTFPIFDSLKKHTKSIALLIEARDRLLPKLMSGEIEV